MRVKSPSIILSILMVSIAMSSCLNTDETTEFSSNASITAFGIDTIYGVEYDFEIDQIRNLIYNRDSLPVSADTIIDKTLITTLSTAGMAVMSGDTLFNAEDSVNLLPAMNKSGSEGMKFKVYAADGITTRTYTLQVRVHRQDPDSLVWKNMAPFSRDVVSGEQKAMAFKGDILVYTSYQSLYRTPAEADPCTWTPIMVSGLPADVRLGTLVSYDGALYAVSGSREVYRSADGEAWEVVPGLGNRVVTLIAEAGGKLSGIVEGETDGKYYFNTCDGMAWDNDGVLQEVPSDFPLEGLYATHSTNGNGIVKTVVVGEPYDGQQSTVPWSTEDGRLWVDYATTEAACPVMKRPFIAYYGGNFYVWGGNMDAIYTSVNGIAWFKTEEKFLFPEAFAGKTNYSVDIDPTVDANDKRDFIWVVFGGFGTGNDVWKGRLNKLGFNEF